MSWHSIWTYPRRVLPHLKVSETPSGAHKASWNVSIPTLVLSLNTEPQWESHIKFQALAEPMEQDFDLELLPYFRDGLRWRVTRVRITDFRLKGHLFCGSKVIRIWAWASWRRFVSKGKVVRKKLIIEWDDLRQRARWGAAREVPLFFGDTLSVLITRLDWRTFSLGKTSVIRWCARLSFCLLDVTCTRLSF